jgi:lipopolysaccharide export LptBFGC system permease protein LptF
VRIITRYVLAQLAMATALALLLLAGVVFALQALRLGHHVLGAGLGVKLLGEVLLYGAPALLLFVLPFALAAGVLFALARLGETNQLLALRVAGVSARQLGRPAVLLCVGAALGALALAAIEPASLQRLRRSLERGAARVLVAKAPARRFSSLGPDATLYLSERGKDGRLGGLLVALERPLRVLVARAATLEVTEEGQARLLLQGGELQMRTAAGRLRRVRFETFRLALDLVPAVRPHLAFLDARAAERWRALGVPLSCLALGLLATALGLRLAERQSARRMWTALVGLGAVVAYAVAQWGATLAWPHLGAAALAAGVAGASAVWLVVADR